MAVRSSARDKKMRQRIALEAARLMAEAGIADYHSAKRKAAAQLGAPDTRNLPRNTEVEQAVKDYQRLFQADDHRRWLLDRYRAALDAMRFLAGFEPRLVGSVLAGTAGEHSDVNLHLFAETPEEVVLFLMENGIPYQTGERRLRVSPQEHASYPSYRFVAGDVPIELIVFPVDGLRQAPLSPVDRKPMQRASLKAVEALVAAED